jgi:hypothetical protein
MSSKQKLSRADKARQLFEAGVRPVQIASHAWEVAGSNGRAYQVQELADGTFQCTCPDALYRSHQGEMCKHAELLLLVREFERIVIAEYADAPMMDVKHDIHLKRDRIVVF